MLEGRAVRLEAAFEAVDVLEVLLHLADADTNARGAAQLPAHMGAAGQVVGVGMGFQHPLDRQPLIAHEMDQFIGGIGAEPSGLRFVVEHRINHRGAAGVRVPDHVGKGGGGLVKKGANLGALRGGHENLLGDIHFSLYSPRPFISQI